jgi:two-component system alkaline phosphatase synthesis response regulator PhoP
MNKAATILIVKSSLQSAHVFEEALSQDGFIVDATTDYASVVEYAISIQPEIIFLPVELENGDGIELCYEIKNNPKLRGIFVVLYSKRKEDYTQIAGLDSGADDYLVSPMQARVLSSKIKALLKRRPQSLVQKNSGDELVYNDIIIDRERYLIIQDGVESYLPKKEFELLSLLLSRPQKVFSREEITQAIWGANPIVQSRTIDVHIRKIREKIGKRYIQTIKGVGYRLEN